MDLLELNVPDLFMIDTEGSTSTIHSDVMASTVPDEFMTFLAEYIQRNNLHEPILKDVQKIWVCLSPQSSPCVWCMFGDGPDIMYVRVSDCRVWLLTTAISNN